MAVIKFSGEALDMSRADLQPFIEADVISFSSTRVVVANIDFVGTFKGSFANFDVNGVPQSGTITSYAEATSDHVLTITGVSMPVPTFLGFVASQNSVGFYSLLLSGKDTIYGTAFNDVILGYAGNDTLFGSAGNDRFVGGAGVDALNYAAATGRVIVNLSRTNAQAIGGGQGADTLSSIENVVGSTRSDILTGNASANTLSGGGGNDILRGGGGADKLIGGLGADTMTGAAGADAFVFDTPGSIDTIVDFSVPDDAIHLENAVFLGLAPGALAAAAFHIGASAADSSDRVIYNSATGALYFDVDGAGGLAKIQIATLAASLLLTNADFVVI